VKPLTNLRTYIDARWPRSGEVLVIDEKVDWKLELGAIIRRSYDLRAPGLFGGIKSPAGELR